jgi:RNA ligase (TIGR02306 family)
MADIKRKLATIRTIKSVEPIENADKILKITFESCGWQCVTDKATNPQVGDRRIYFEIDSVLPDIPVFEFMRDYKFRVKTIKLRGTCSQGLSVPVADFQTEIAQAVIDTLPEWKGKELASVKVTDLPEGFDVTDCLKVVKYELPENTQIGGDTKGPFPGFIERTDEERVENLTNIEELLANHQFDVTVKMDGSSGTYFLFNGEFGVCSRNQEIKDSEGNAFWKMARKYNIEERMRGMGRNLAIQGEVAGPGVQNNRAGLTELQFFVFTIQDLDKDLITKRLNEALNE